MGQINQASNLLDRIKGIEGQLGKLWKSVGLASATIAAGGLTLLNNAYFKMVGASNNELVYIGPDGANQVVRIRDAAGNIIFGSVTAGTGGQRVAINPEPTGTARIDLYDDGTTTDHVSLNMFGGSFVMQRETNAARVINGGKASFYNGQTYFGHQTPAADSYLKFDNSGQLVLRGKWVQDNAESGESATFVGNYDLTAAFALVNWGPTMASRMAVVTDIFYNGASITQHNIDQLTSTGFGVRWSPSAAVRLTYIAFRINQAW